MTTSDVLALIALVLSTLTALGTVGATIYWSRRQERLARDLRDREESLARELHNRAERLSRELHQREEERTLLANKREEVLTQRQMFVEIWPHLSRIREINPHSPPPPDEVWRTINVLDLVATCWEAEIVSEDVLKRTTSTIFLKLYDSIYDIKEIPWKIGDTLTKKTGPELLRQCPAVGLLYKILDDERQRLNVVPKL